MDEPLGEYSPEELQKHMDRKFEIANGKKMEKEDKSEEVMLSEPLSTI